jgi:hypothetical protein
MGWEKDRCHLSSKVFRTASILQVPHDFEAVLDAFKTRYAFLTDSDRESTFPTQDQGKRKALL